MFNISDAPHYYCCCLFRNTATLLRNNVSDCLPRCSVTVASVAAIDAHRGVREAARRDGQGDPDGGVQCGFAAAYLAAVALAWSLGVVVVLMVIVVVTVAVVGAMAAA
ncbi:Protein PRY2 [Fonsecaea nubica]|uniref:Protein PRY2 n=1 Tax=Fonsecaea nubica TaxID=856822 RepID=A0A178D9I0_9EURO|nr:Protein PRY2 [Fonsecaea nubica]OAL38014.1 Protein PRY2 [Fonsecaea nubica]